MRIMQNHPIYKTTPEQGWSQMVPVLDKAMPVARRSRRILAYWWTAAAVIMAVVITRLATPDAISNRDTDNISTNVEVSKPSTTAHENTAQTSDITNSTTPTKDNNTSSASPELNQHDNVTKSHNSIGDKNESIVSSQNALGDKHNSKQPKSPLPQSKLPKDEKWVAIETSVNADISQNGNAQQNNEVAVTEIVTTNETAVINPNVSMHEMVALETLPAMEIDALPVDAFMMDDIQPGSIKRALPKKKLFTPHVDASVLETYSTGFAAYAGGGVDINILPRLSITTGAGCSIYNPGLALFSSNADRTEAEDYESLLKSDLSNMGIPEYLPATEFSNTSPDVLTKFVSSIRQWHVSAGLKYDLSRKFYLEGGATLNMLSSVHSKYPIVSVLLVNDPYTGGNLDVSHSFEDFNLIQSQTTSLYAGLGYRPGKKTELFAQWVHGADSYLKGSNLQSVNDGENGEYIRGLSLGFRYNL